MGSRRPKLIKYLSVVIGHWSLVIWIWSFSSSFVIQNDRERARSRRKRPAPTHWFVERLENYRQSCRPDYLAGRTPSAPTPLDPLACLRRTWAATYGYDCDSAAGRRCHGSRSAGRSIGWLQAVAVDAVLAAEDSLRRERIVARRGGRGR